MGKKIKKLNKETRLLNDVDTLNELHYLSEIYPADYEEVLRLYSVLKSKEQIKKHFQKEF